LSVITTTTVWSSTTTSATLTCHSPISAGATPSPTSGSFMVRTPISSLHYGLKGAAYPCRAREVVPFLRVRVGRVPTGHPDDRRLQMIETGLLDQRRQFRAEAGGQRRLVHDDTASRLLHRGLDRLQVQRHQRAQIDHLRI